MSQVKWIALVITLIGGGAFIWLKQHDATVRWRAMAENRQEQMRKSDQEADAFRMSVESLGLAMARRQIDYVKTRKEMTATVKKLQSEIEALAASAYNIEGLPTEAGNVIRDIVKKCQDIEVRVTDQLQDCDELRRDDSLMSIKKDILIVGISESRDAWRREATDALDKTKGKTSTWITVGSNVITAIFSFILGKKSDD
jgi:hypothetical protein